MARIARIVVAGYPHHITQRGHLWQGRFSSYVMGNKYLMSAVQYAALNPVKAGLVRRLEQYRWSSAAAYLVGKKDTLTSVSALNRRVDDWREFLSQAVDPVIIEKTQRHERTGRPLGSERFVIKLEGILDRILRPKKAGRPKKVRKK